MTAKSAVLAIDVQIALVTNAYREIEVLAAINQTISAVREANGVVVFIQHCHQSFEPLKQGAPGWQIHPQLNRMAGDLVVQKTASDAFYATQLEDQLRDNGVDHVYVTGLQTEYCVDTTARSALSKGFAVTLVSDAHTTGDSHMSAAQTIKHHNAVLANVAHPVAPISVRTSSSI